MEYFLDGGRAFSRCYAYAGATGAGAWGFECQEQEGRMMIVRPPATASPHLRIWRRSTTGDLRQWGFPGHYSEFHFDMFLPPNTIHLASLVRQASEKTDRSSADR